MENINEVVEQAIEIVAKNEDCLPESVKNQIEEIDIITQQSKKNMETLSNNEEFQKASYLVDEQKVVTELARQQIDTEKQKFENELSKYIIEKQKESLDYRKKKEKKLIKQEVEAEVKQAKRIIAEKRFGYLYEEDGTYTIKVKDETGKYVDVTYTKYKNFSPSYFINIMKEIQVWYKNQTDTVKKIIWTTVKFIVFSGVLTGVGFLIAKIIKTLISNGILNLGGS